MLVVGAAAVALAAPSVAVADSTSVQGKGKGKDMSTSECVTISFLERLISTETREVAPTGPSVGDTVITLDAVIDDRGKQIGTNDIIGTIIRQDAETGELFSFSTSKYEFKGGGVIRVAGEVNLTALASGKTLKMPAYGTGGEYAGKTGTLTWTLVNGLESENSITLCG